MAATLSRLAHADLRTSKAEDHQSPPEICVVAERSGKSDRPQALTRFGQSGGQSDRRPSAYTRQNGHVLLAIVRIGDRVTDDSRGTMHLVQHLAITHVHRPKPSVKCAVKRDAAGGGQDPAPILELVVDRPLGISRYRIKRNEASADLG